LASLAFMLSPSLFAQDEKSGQITVESVGTGETRDAALIDACRLAVAKVHGTRITGKMINHGSSGFKGTSSSDKGVFDKTTESTEVKTFAVSDNTAMSFDGLLLRYSIKKEEKIPSDRWSISITADVLKALPDRFAGSQAVVIPSANRIAASIRKASGDTHGISVPEIASTIAKGLSETFANNPQFVILERESEDVVDGELALASSENAAVREQSKLKGEKAADMVLEFQSGPLVVDVLTTTFSNTPPLQKVSMRFSGTIRLIDVMTKGEVGRSQFEVASEKPTVSAGAVASAVQAATTDFNAALQRSIRVMKCDMMLKLNMANFVVTPDGCLKYLGRGNGTLLETGDSITLWKTVSNQQTQVAKTTIKVDGDIVRMDEQSSLKKGDIVSLRISNTKTSASGTNQSHTEEAAPKPSLKESLGF